MAPSDLSILHLGAGQYGPDDRHHATFDIWRQLAKGFAHYTVIGRSTTKNWGRIEEGNLVVLLVPSRTRREIEFLATQFWAVPIAVKIRPNVVVAQCPALGGLAAQRIARLTGARTLLEIHMAGYVQPADWGTRWWTLQRLSRLTLPKATRIRALSAGMKRDLLDFYDSVLDSNIEILPPRVDLRRFSVHRTNWQLNGRPKVALVGSVTERKGQLRYLTAILKSGIEVESWIIGDGPQRAACEELIAATNAKDRVKFFGALSHHELAYILPNADAFVQFSSMEGTPRAIMEAMAVGLPIVTTDVGYCSDVVEHGIEGFVLGRDAERELPNALETLFRDCQLRERMGKAGIARVAREFEASTIYERYRGLIADTARA